MKKTSLGNFELSENAPQPSEKLSSILDKMFEDHKNLLADIEKIQQPTAIKLTLNRPQLDVEVDRVMLSSSDPSGPSIQFDVSPGVQRPDFTEQLQHSKLNLKDEGYTFVLSSSEATKPTIRAKAHLIGLENAPVHHLTPPSIESSKVGESRVGTSNLIQKSPHNFASFEISKPSTPRPPIKGPSTEIANSFNHLTLSSPASSTPMIQATLSRKDSERIVNGEISGIDLMKPLDRLTISFSPHSIGESICRSVAEAIDISPTKMILLDERFVQNK